MQSKNTGYLEPLDHLRAGAAVLVVLFHAKLQLVGRGISTASFVWIDQGHVGVPLFMVISGFILSHIAASNVIDIRGFYLNRILRIYPVMVCSLIASFYFYPPAAYLPLKFLCGLTPATTIAILADIDCYSPSASVFWSVAVELQFYLIFPFLWPWLRRTGPWGYAGVFGGLLLARTIIFLCLGTVHRVAFFTLFGAMDAFLFGCIVQVAYVKYSAVKLSLVVPALCFVVATVIMIAAFSNLDFYHVDYLARYGTIYSTSNSAMWIIWPTVQAAMLAAIVFTYLLSAPRNNVLAWLGQRSYSLYAWHALMLLQVPRALFSVFGMPFQYGLMFALPACLLTAAISYRWIELPFLRRRLRYIWPASENGRTTINVMAQFPR